MKKILATEDTEDTEFIFLCALCVLCGKMEETYVRD